MRGDFVRTLFKSYCNSFAAAFGSLPLADEFVIESLVSPSTCGSGVILWISGRLNGRGTSGSACILRMTEALFLSRCASNVAAKSSVSTSLSSSGLRPTSLE